VNIPADHPLADYANVLPALQFRVIADNPLTLQKEDKTFTAEDKRGSGERYAVLITFLGLRDVPVSTESLLAILEMQSVDIGFHTEISNGKMNLDAVLGIPEPISAKDILAIVALGAIFVPACQKVVDAFGGRLETP
jgi:hypothetical protein